ncbi:Hydantoin racemase [compost metagenome]
MWPRWYPLYRKTIQEYGLESRLASVRSIDVRPDTAALLQGREEVVFEKLLEAGRRAIEEDGADVIVLGSTTMHQSHAYLAEHLPVPVLNPGVVAYKMCEVLLDLGLSHSKRAYPSPEQLKDAAFAAF